MKKQIYITTFVKLVRGCVKGLGIKRKFPMFVGRKAEITHKRNIHCGKMLNLRPTRKFMVYQSKGYILGTM